MLWVVVCKAPTQFLPQKCTIVAIRELSLSRETWTNICGFGVKPCLFVVKIVVLLYLVNIDAMLSE